MRSETVTVGEISAVVRSRTRRTAIIEAVYKKALAKAHPEIEAYEQAQYETLTPDLPVDKNGKIKEDLTPEQATVFARYTQRFSAMQQQNAVGASYVREVRDFVPLLARITDLHGTAFDLTPPQFVDVQVNAAFEDWLDETHEDFWTVIGAAVARMDEPLTPLEQKPPETLTEAEQADPLPVSVG